jgi:hypothetical protein
MPKLTITELCTKLRTATIIGLSFSIMACRKDVSLPDPSFEKLFGTWEWVWAYGGFQGATITPSTAGYSQTIEFKENGIYKIYENGEQKDKMEFTLTDQTSALNTNNRYLIKYKDTGLFDKNDYTISQYASFGGQDTLFLNDSCSDCFQYIYVRKK